MLRVLFALLKNILSNVLFFPFRVFRLFFPPKDGTFVQFTVHREVVRWSSPSSWSDYFRDKPEDLPLKEWGKRLKKLARDPAVAGILLHTEKLNGNFSALDELRLLVSWFREQGKEVVYVPNQLGNAEFYLSTAASRTVLSPHSTVSVTLPSLQMLFFGDFLRKWGAEPVVYKVGKHKNAPEPYERGFPSPTNRRDLEALLAQYRAMFLGPLAEHKELASQTAALERGVFTLEEALEAGFVHAIRFHDRLAQYLAEENPTPYELPERPCSNEEIEKLRVEREETTEQTSEKEGSAEEKEGEEDEEELDLLMDYEDYESARPALIHWKPIRKKPLVGVVPVVGNIVDEAEGGVPSQEAAAVRDNVVEALEEAAAARRVKAVVVFVDSRGGSGYASEAMWRAVRRVQAQKPVVAFFADYAASGGYYVGCGAQHIVCAPTGVTGSIGVFGGKLLLRNALKKLNIGVTVVGETEGTRLFSPFTEGQQGDVERVQEQMQAFYQRFLSRVGENRGMSLEQVHELAEGRVYLGPKALELGLVDELGSFGTAIKAAAEFAKLPEADIKLFQTQKRNSNLERLLNFRGSLFQNTHAPHPLLTESQQLGSLLQSGAPLLWHPPLQWEVGTMVSAGLSAAAKLSTGR